VNGERLTINSLIPPVRKSEFDEFDSGTETIGERRKPALKAPPPNVERRTPNVYPLG
jgi:hypothetical protein